MSLTCHLSINVNKIALLRNARGGNNPDLVKTAARLVEYGADGITVHPRPDERHVRFADVPALKQMLGTVELNVEGYPDARWMEMVLNVKPAQATLVPDAPDALTSTAGWDTLGRAHELEPIIKRLHNAGIRTSIFVNPESQYIEGAARLGADRVELYTEPYAANYHVNRLSAVAPYIQAAAFSTSLGLGVNAGHDLDLDNLAWLIQQAPQIEEVSIGHALIADALTFGLENVVRMYKRQIERG